MTDDELLATVLRRFLRSGNLVFSDCSPEAVFRRGTVTLSREESAALLREQRACEKARLLALARAADAARSTDGSRAIKRVHPVAGPVLG